MNLSFPGYIITRKTGDIVSLRKKFYVNLILKSIIIISIIFVLLDWMPILNKDNTLDTTMYSYGFKALLILLISLLIFITGEDALNEKDAIIIKVIFILVIIADSSLVLFNTPVIGIMFFSFVQFGLILRNSRGMREKIKINRNNKLRTSLFVNTILATLLFIFNLIRLMNGLMEEKLLLLIMALYGLMVSLSLWTAFANYLVGIFPKINSLFVALGMFFFVLCDLNVGLSLILPNGYIRDIASALVWIFYTPALTLIALSGYRFNTK